MSKLKLSHLLLIAWLAGSFGCMHRTGSTGTASSCNSLRSQLASALQSALDSCRTGTTPSQCVTTEGSAVSIWAQVCACACTAVTCNRAPNNAEIPLVILSLINNQDNPSHMAATACQ